MSEARALLEGIVSQWDAGKASDDILTPDLIHEARVLVQRADRPEARVAAEGLTRVDGAISMAMDSLILMPDDGDELPEAAENAYQLMQEARDILARLPAPRPPEPDRTAALVEALRFLATYEKNPPEVIKDDFAYDRLLAFVRDVAARALAHTPDEAP